MADFRKWLLALAAVAVLLGFDSSTALAQPAFTCNTNASVPTIVRVDRAAALAARIPPTGKEDVLTILAQVSLETTIASAVIRHALWDLVR